MQLLLHIAVIRNLIILFKVTRYVSVKYFHLSLFKYSYIFRSVKTIIRSLLQCF